MNISITPYGNLLLSDGNLYSVEIPATVGGLELIKSILLSRQLGSIKLGQSGALTQAQVNAAVEEYEKRKFAHDFANIDLKGFEI